MSFDLRRWVRPFPALRLVGLLLSASYLSASAVAAPTNVINMPTARLLPDGTWVIDYIYGDPYVNTATSITLLPWLEVGGGVTRMKGVPGLQGVSGFEQYGDNKDKNFFGKALLLNENPWVPAVAYFINDPEGTGLFKGHGIVANKAFFNNKLDISAGYGSVRPSGAFGGAKWDFYNYEDHKFKALFEVDGNKYQNDAYAAQSGLNQPKSRINYGLQYDWTMFGAKVSHQGTNNSTLYEAYLKIPLDDKHLIPKVDEPERYTAITPRPDIDQWMKNPRYRRELIKALADQDFRDITINYDPYARKLTVTASNGRISQMSRAVGRAAQTALLLCPLETDEIDVTYVDKRLPLVTYSFFDLKRLRRYFNGQIPRKDLEGYVSIKHASPDKGRNLQSPSEALDDPTHREQVNIALDELRNEDSARATAYNSAIFNAQGVSLQGFEDYSAKISPALYSYLDGPGSYQYALNIYGSGNLWVTRQTEFKGGLFVPVAQNLTQYGVADTQPGLPAVRSNLPLYYSKQNLKLDQAVLNNYKQLGTSTYARVSAGIYELMYSGFGGQILYAPQNKNWSIDATADQVYQRNYDGWLGTNGYKTFTGMVNGHYRMPMGLTGTVRFGKFLAKDVGARFEISRTFRSGFEVGGWYTVTDANDQLSGSQYYDKGVWLKIPFDALATKDTRNTGTMFYSPWGRNSGQMVVSPGDLYAMIDGPYRYNLTENRALARLADVDDDYNLPALGAQGSGVLERPVLDAAWPDLKQTAKELDNSSVWLRAGLGLAITGASTVFDRAMHNFGTKYGSNKFANGVADVGDALPYVSLLGGLVAVINEDKRLADTGLASLLGTGLALAASSGLKYAVGRERPDQTNDPFVFKPGTSGSSFPSNHTAAVFAGVTPFAKEYDAPWLYDIASVTNLARILKNQHWFSDTMGGSLLGFGLSSLVWKAGRKTDNEASVYIQGQGIGISVPLK